ncbi:MAG: hypothetical protein JWM98_990 [Thermoleophilia bacterium]|nr:hypothetical protein [Thermoleophilia bacterium]
MALAAINDLRIVVGGQRVLDEGVALVGRAHTSLSGEFFILNDETARAAFADAWQGRGIPGSAVITAHPQIIDQAAGLVAPRVSVAHYGDLAPSTAPREFIHTKTTARDMHTADPEALLSTASYGGNARRELEFAGVLHGDAARAVHELADSVTSRDWQRQRDAIAWARTQGIYLTDPVTKERGLPEAISSLVAEEPRHLTVAMKTMVDVRFANEIAARRAAGVDVDVIVERIDQASHDALVGSGVHLLKPSDADRELHGNVIIAEGLGHAYWGTLWASPRSFARDHVPNLYTGGGDLLPPSKRWDRSREIGGITNAAGAIDDLRAGLATLEAAPHDYRAGGGLIVP